MTENSKIPLEPAEPALTDPPQLDRQSVFWYYRRCVRTCYRTFGFGLTTIGYALGEGFVRVAGFRALKFDTRLHGKKLAATEVRNPFFIIGHPRSGTTFLHNLLIGTDETAAFKAWQLYWPALVGRPAAKLLIALKKRFGTTVILPEWTGHRVDMDEYDEEEFLFNLTYDGPIKTAVMLGLDDDEYPELEHPDLLPEAERRRALDQLDGYFRRQIIATGNAQIVAQMHFSTLRLKSLLAYYPDAHFVYIVRDPLHTIPSFLTLNLNAIKARWGLDKVRPEVITRLIQRRYRAMLGLYKYFFDLEMAGEIPAERVMVLRYGDLVDDVRGTLDRIRDFSGMTFSPKLEAHIDAATERQSGYRRKHEVMSLEDLGLDRETILKDFAFVYERYGIEPRA